MTDDPKNDVSDAVNRAAQVARSALERAGEAVGDLLSGFGGGEPALTTDVLPEVLPLPPVSGGAEVATRVRFANDGEASTEPFTVTATDLVSGEDRIPAAAVSVGPHQRVVAAGTTDTVRVTVAVPEGAAPGTYSGELKPSESAVAPAALTIEVR